MRMLACCESYLLFGIGAAQRGVLMLLNPATRIYRIITQDYNPRWSDYVRYGMCHCSDEFNNDYFKVAKFFQYNDPQGYSRSDITVYSFRTNLLNYTVRITATTGVLIENPVLVQNHLLAMLCYGSDRFMRIGCFDIKAERWSNDVPLSDILLGEIGSNQTRDGHHHLGVLEGQLCFSCYDENKSTYNIWVMRNFGVKSSWFKLMSFPVQGTQHVYHPIAYRKGSLHELLCIQNESGKYLWYNLRDKQFTETGLDGNSNAKDGVYFVTTGYAFMRRVKEKDVATSGSDKDDSVWKGEQYRCNVLLVLQYGRI
ncbi:F-box protein At4g22390-like [Silene latifolia]|uniref:F-box protein At4g22390-like n=1 Tax=Silene latifolia TaxID=37657 RepID=UPI003D78A2C4